MSDDYDMRCGECQYERRIRQGEEWLEGFCKCTGSSIDIRNHEVEAPEWCPLR